MASNNPPLGFHYEWKEMEDISQFSKYTNLNRITVNTIEDYLHNLTYNQNGKNVVVDTDTGLLNFENKNNHTHDDTYIPTTRMPYLIDMFASDYTPNLNDDITVTVKITDFYGNPVRKNITVTYPDGTSNTVITNNDGEYNLSTSYPSQYYTCSDWGLQTFKVSPSINVASTSNAEYLVGTTELQIFVNDANKGLSTNDFTNNYKNTVEGISNWEQINCNPGTLYVNKTLRMAQWSNSGTVSIGATDTLYPTDNSWGFSSTYAPPNSIRQRVSNTENIFVIITSNGQIHFFTPTSSVTGNGKSYNSCISWHY